MCKLQIDQFRYITIHNRLQTQQNYNSPNVIYYVENIC